MVSALALLVWELSGLQNCFLLHKDKTAVALDPQVLDQTYDKCFKAFSGQALFFELVSTAVMVFPLPVTDGAGTTYSSLWFAGKSVSITLPLNCTRTD